MQYRLFQYPLPADPELAELNAFLANHRIATISQQIVSTAGGAMLVFVVELATSAVATTALRTGKSKIDYREVLTDGEFQIFSSLRERRKELAAEEGVPVYAVFTNAQLAEMVQKRLTSKSDLAKIDGVGNARSDKYAPHFLPILSAAFESEKVGHGGAES